MCISVTWLGGGHAGHGPGGPAAQCPLPSAQGLSSLLAPPFLRGLSHPPLLMTPCVHIVWSWSSGACTQQEAEGRSLGSTSHRSASAVTVHTWQPLVGGHRGVQERGGETFLQSSVCSSSGLTDNEAFWSLPNKVGRLATLNRPFRVVISSWRPWQLPLEKPRGL